MRHHTFSSFASSLTPIALSVSFMLTPMASLAGENSHSRSTFRASSMKKISASQTSTVSPNQPMSTNISNNAGMMKRSSSSNMNKVTTTGSTSNLSKNASSGFKTGTLNTSAGKLNHSSLGNVGLKKTGIGVSDSGMRHMGSSSTIGMKTAGSSGIGNLKGSAPWLKSGSMTGIGKSLESKGIDVTKTTGTLEGTGLPPAPGGPIPIPYPNTGIAGKDLSPILKDVSAPGSSTGTGLEGSKIGKVLNPDLINKTKIGDLLGNSKEAETPPSANPEPNPSGGSDPAPGSGSSSESDPGSGGGSGGGSEPAEGSGGAPLEDHHDGHHHHDCYWDIHTVQPYFHTHCWHPTEACYVVWVYRSGSWVNEKVTDLAPLSTEVPLEFIAVSEPVPYEYDETLADGTVVHKSGVWWMGADEKPHGQENWSATILGPEMASAFKSLPPQP
jgi:hypothetical protein